LNRRNTISLCLKIHINDLTILIHCTPEIMLLAVYLHEDFIDVECVAIALMLSLQPAGKNGSAFDGP
jgi:hypothetical protein